jgi:3-oxoacyl-[acyl-carrier protein] reductase
MRINLSGRVSLITGAGKGIGAAIARSFAESGARVAIGYNQSATSANQLVEELASKDFQAIAVQIDVSNAESCESAVQAITDQWGPVEILVNNAGVIADDLFLMLERNAWEKVLDTNLMGTVNATKACIRGMMMKRFGRVINITSVAASKGGRGQSNYAASKGAVEAMTRSLAVEFGSKGITVNCVAPGVIETDMSKEVVQLAKDEILSRQVIKRLGKPEEIAGWVAMLASDFGSFITGEVIHVDGGMKLP